jgi:hypothetical protein
LGFGVVATATVGIAYLVGRDHAAGIPAPATALTYTAVLTDGAGAPLTGMKNIQVILWDAATNGTQQCASASTALTLQAGSFSLTLPATCTAAIHASPDLWAELLVDGGSLGRTKLGAVPYAIEADKAAGASGNFAVPGDLTVSGKLSVGLRVSTDCTYSAAGGYTDCTCAAGEYAIGGGGYDSGTNFLQESRNPVATEPATLGLNWRTSCSNSGGARVQCTSPQAICVRLAP